MCINLIPVDPCGADSFSSGFLELDLSSYSSLPHESETKDFHLEVKFDKGSSFCWKQNVFLVKGEEDHTAKVSLSAYRQSKAVKMLCFSLCTAIFIVS